MEKLVVKTAVKTVLIILGVFIAVFAIFNFAFPQHMASVTESIGNYELAVKYASLRYYYTKNCDDLARCFDDSVLSGKDEYVLQYGEQLINHEGYRKVCDRKDFKVGSDLSADREYGYDHWVKGKIVVAYYNSGEIDKAINMAFEDNGRTSFVYGNSVMTLSSRVLAENDGQTARKILDRLENEATAITPTDDAQSGYLTTVRQRLKGIDNN